MKPSIYLSTFLIVLAVLFSFSFKTKQATCNAEKLNYPNGASANLGVGYTGASWDNGGQTCGSCHSGGTYKPTTSITLLSGTTPVSSYVPGTMYTFNIKITSTSGAPKYAFNAMCATGATNININDWGTMPTGSRNTLASARNYIEQSSARTATGTSPASYYSINIPWTAPVSGTGNITFYAEGMAVNGTGGTGGDSPTPGVNITIPETGTLPVKFINISAQKNNRSANICWSTEIEINISNYIVEHSTDGIHFETLGTINSNSNNAIARNSYCFTHENIAAGNHFYRIDAVDIDNSKSYSSIVSLSNSRINNFIISPNPVMDIINLPADQFSGSNYTISGITGQLFNGGQINNNQISIVLLSPGSYILTVLNKSGKKYTSTFIKE